MLKKFMITRTLASLGDSILMFALPLMIFKVTGSVVYSGLAFMIEWLPRVMWLPFSGIFIDRFGGRAVLMVSDGLRALGCIAVFFAFRGHLFANQFVPLVLLSAVVALLSGQTFIALEALMRQTLTLEQMPKGQSMLEACNMISLLAGPGVGAFLILFLKVEVLFGLSALVYVFGLVNMMLIKMGGSETKSSASWVQLSSGLKEFVTSSRLLGIALFGAMANIIYGGAMALAPAITKLTFAQSDQAYAAMVSTLGLTSLLSLIVVPLLSKRFSLDGLRFASLVVIFLGTGAMIVAPSYWIFVLGFGLLLAGITILNIFMRTLRAQHVSRENFARTVSFMIMFSQLPLPLSGFFVARLGDRWSTTSMLTGIAGASVVLAIVACILLSEAPALKFATRKSEGTV